MRALLPALAVIAAVTAAPALSETQTEYVVAEQRTAVSVHVNPQALRPFLPTGWTLSAQADAPNLTIIFMDRTMALTPDGKPLGNGSNRLMVLSVGAKNEQTGETRGMIVGGISTDNAGVPGAYKVYNYGVVTLRRGETSAEVSGGKIETRVVEHWQAQGDDGARVNFDLMFKRGLPTRRIFESKNYSGIEPNFYRIYRGEQLVDPVDIGRPNLAELKVSGGKLGKVFDGTQKIVSVSSSPFYTRKTFLP